MKELAFEQWEKINDFFEDRKDEAERMAILHKYKINMTLISMINKIKESQLLALKKKTLN